MARPAHTKVTREDWIEAALGHLDAEPIDKLKILSLAAELGVSRSSFYWYFDEPSELRDELLLLWDRNTTSIVERSERSTSSTAAAVLAIYECWADVTAYNAVLDLAVRDWGRRDDKMAESVRVADQTRLDALAEMFRRHGAGNAESVARSRLVYHGQVGYYAVQSEEPMETRLLYLPHYLLAVAGSLPTDEELASFKRFLLAIERGKDNTATRSPD